MKAIFSVAETKLAAMTALEASSLEYTCVINGFFLDYYVIPKVSSHMGPFPVVVDMANNAAAIPGSGDVPVAFTHTTDVARFADGAAAQGGLLFSTLSDFATQVCPHILNFFITVLFT